MLVEFSCGCIGLTDIPGDEEHGNRALVLYPCDLNGEDCWYPLSAYRRDLSDKTHEPLEAAESAKLMGDIQRLLQDGYRFRRLKEILD